MSVCPCPAGGILPNYVDEIKVRLNLFKNRTFYTDTYLNLWPLLVNIIPVIAVDSNR